MIRCPLCGLRGKHPVSSVKQISILIVETCPVFLEGLALLLGREPGFHVAGKAFDLGEAVRMARELTPDVLLISVSSVSRPILDARRGLEESPIGMRIVFFAPAIERTQITELLRQGVRGVISREASPAVLAECIRAVMTGQYWLERETVSDVVEALCEDTHSNGNGAAENFGLTRRELEIIGAVVAGCANREVAEQLGLREQTVKHYVSRIFDKVGVSTRLELALFALNHRLVASN
jgi:two-component system, NarL family, nitrate/nitrite response regulator NarL